MTAAAWALCAAVLVGLGIWEWRRLRRMRQARKALTPHPAAQRRGGCRVCGKRKVRHVVSSNRGVEGEVCSAWCGQRLIKRLKEAA